MSQHMFVLTAGIVFSLVVLLHALRLLKRWPVTIGPWRVPTWISTVALVFAAFLAYTAFTL